MELSDTDRHRIRFTLTERHVALLRRMSVGWQDCDAGAPEIDPKRPYGNSSVFIDLAEILDPEGWEAATRAGDERRWTPTRRRTRTSTGRCATRPGRRSRSCCGAGV